MGMRGDVTGAEKNYLLDMLEIDSRVLEIGCGDGRLTRKYAREAAQVIGIDLPAALPGAGSEPLPAAMSVAGASGTDLPFPASRFDQAIFALSL